MSKAAALLALQLALAAGDPPAPPPTVPPPPQRPACGCSVLCTCGCQSGRPCRCRQYDSGPPVCLPEASGGGSSLTPLAPPLPVSPPQWVPVLTAPAALQFPAFAPTPAPTMAPTLTPLARPLTLPGGC